MARPLFLGLLTFGFVLAGLAGLDGDLLALAIPIALYGAYGLWRTPYEIQLEIRRKVSQERVAPGTPVRVELTIVNSGHDLEELSLEDVISPTLELVDGRNQHLTSLSAGGSFTFEYKVKGPRGGFPFSTLRAEAGDHLGLFRMVKSFRTSGQLIVLPTLPRVKDVPIRPRRTRVYAGAIPARLGGAGVEFFGVRAFERGDSARQINWRASARHTDDLYVNEYQQERVADVAVVLDGRERSNVRAAGQSLFEYSVIAAGALADACLHQGNRVGLLVYSHYLHWTLPGYGKVQRERILSALAQAAPGASQIFEGLEYLPARLFPAKSQIILISSLVEQDYSTLLQLRARDYQVMVVCPDPIGFEEIHLQRRSSRYSMAEVGLSARILRLERQWMLGRVRGAGVQVVEWDVSQPFDQVVRRSFRAGRMKSYP